jgi:YHS domain-containing protein
MFKKLVVVSIVLVALFAIAGAVMAQEAGNQTTAAVTSAVVTETAPAVTPAVATPVNVGNKFCPVTGEKVSGNDTVEYQGKVYNLCCPMCKDTFSADPAKYMAKVEEELARAGEAAVTQEKPAAEMAK